jgi:hypothetical protein
MEATDALSEPLDELVLATSKNVGLETSADPFPPRDVSSSENFACGERRLDIGDAAP